MCLFPKISLLCKTRVGLITDRIPVLLNWESQKYRQYFVILNQNPVEKAKHLHEMLNIRNICNNPLSLKRCMYFSQYFSSPPRHIRKFSVLPIISIYPPHTHTHTHKHTHSMYHLLIAFLSFLCPPSLHSSLSGSFFILKTFFSSP